MHDSLLVNLKIRSFLLETLDNEFLSRNSLVEISDVSCHALKVRAGIVGSADEDLVLCTIGNWLVDWCWVAQELLFNWAEALEASLDFEVVVGIGFGNGADDGDVVALRADVVGGGDHSDVNV